MIFSTDKTTLLREIQEFLPFASNYDLERVIPLLEDTEKHFLTPLLGTALHERLTKDMGTYNEEIKMCRKAVANIMVYMNFTLLNTQLLPGGFTRISGENTSSLYKYQEEDLKKIFRRNGFDQLDVIVEYFMKNRNIRLLHFRATRSDTGSFRVLEILQNNITRRFQTPSTIHPPGYRPGHLSHHHHKRDGLARYQPFTTDSPDRGLPCRGLRHRGFGGEY